MVFLGFNDALDKKRDIKVTCIESGSLEGVYNPSTRRKQPPSTDNSIQETDDGKESASVLENTSDEKMETDTNEIEDKGFLQCWKEYTKKILKRCRKRFNRNNNCAQNIYTSDDSPKYPGVGILVITHLLAAATGCGILYFVLKKIGRLRNAKNKSEGNKGYTNSSYSQQENTTRITIPHTIHDYNEGLYHEVESKMTAIQFDNQIKSNSFTKSIPSPGRKLSKLPDIPQEPDKDEYDYLIPQTGKDGSQTDKHLKYTELNPEEREKELKTEDSTNSEELDNSPKTSCLSEDKTDDYFVLEKSTDMDLK
ncbi:uncharacterized protein LOC134235678 isoform X2 [Saccostrea cucullata]|uniref:uncharacterized protein LOC134235678 isoform X2 n=1 Tax=Saccostrea cuccullata TaxID=36930 RepID=UPI002ED5DBCF